MPLDGTPAANSPNLAAVMSDDYIPAVLKELLTLYSVTVGVGLRTSVHDPRRTIADVLKVIKHLLLEALSCQVDGQPPDIPCPCGRPQVLVSLSWGARWLGENITYVVAPPDGSAVRAADSAARARPWAIGRLAWDFGEVLDALGDTSGAACTPAIDVAVSRGLIQVHFVSREQAGVGVGVGHGTGRVVGVDSLADDIGGAEVDAGDVVEDVLDRAGDSEVAVFSRASGV